MRGESSTGLLIGGVLLLVLLGGGLFMLGVFEGSEVVEPDDGLTHSGPENPVAQERTPGTLPIEGGSIDTKGYEGEASRGGAGVTRVGDTQTGIYAGGKVVDSAGNPIEGAEIALIRDISPMKTSLMEGEVLASVKTGKTGSFDFESMPKTGTFLFRARHADYTTEYAGGIRPESGAIARQRLVMKTGMAMTGRVNDKGSVGIPEALVRVFDLNVKSADPLGALERQARTLADGSFEVAHLKPGLKKIIVSKEGWSTDGRQAINLNEGENNPLVFVLQNGHLISGIVMDARTGLPIVGATVNARPVSYINLAAINEDELRARGQLPDSGDSTSFRAHGGEDGGKPIPPIHRVRGQVGEKAFLVAKAETDEHGRFALHGLLEARYMVSVIAEGYQPMTGRPANAGATDVEFKLIPSASISGLVIDAETGEPVLNYAISVSPQEQPVFIPEQMKKRFETTDGRFEFPDVRPGKQFVIAMAEGYAPARSEPYIVSNEQIIEGVVLRLERGATLLGRVVDSQGEPIKGAVATMVPDRSNQPPNPFATIIHQQMNRNSTFRATTDAKGEFQIIGVGEGDYQINVKHSNYMDENGQGFHVTPRGDLDVGTFTMSKGGTVIGSVSRKDGKPDSQATIMLQNTDSAFVASNRSAQTGSDGSFELKGVVPGTYRIMVTQREGQVNLLEILQGQQNAQQITVTDGGVVELAL